MRRALNQGRGSTTVWAGTPGVAEGTSMGHFATKSAAETKSFGQGRGLLRNEAAPWHKRAQAGPSSPCPDRQTDPSRAKGFSLVGKGSKPPAHGLKSPSSP